MTAFNKLTTAAEAATALSKEITGKNVIITGVRLGGLANEALKVIVKYASLVVITGRRQDVLDEVIQAVKAETPAANIRTVILELGSFKSVRKAAAEINAYPETFHVLINSASNMSIPYSVTEDGLETSMAVNHWGPFLFTALIYPRILASGTKEHPARIVNITSRAFFISPVRFDDVGFEGGKTYNKWAAYGQSKSANVLFANEIARRAKEKDVPVVAYSVHPGRVHTTNLGAHIPDEELIAFGAKNAQGEWQGEFDTAECAAANYIVAAFDPALLSKPGAYLTGSHVEETDIAPHVQSQEFGEKLWTLSEETVKEKFVI